MALRVRIQVLVDEMRGVVPDLDERKQVVMARRFKPGAFVVPQLCRKVDGAVRQGAIRN